MEINYKDNMFYIGDINDPDGKIIFNETEEITITMTFVKEELRGRGIGRSLFNKVSEYAKSKNKEVISTCSFASGKLKE